MPGAEEVDASITAATGALEVEGKVAKSVLNRVLVVSSYIGGGCQGKGGAVRVGEEAGEVVVQGCRVGRKWRSRVGGLWALSIIVVVCSLDFWRWRRGEGVLESEVGVDASRSYWRESRCTGESESIAAFRDGAGEH